MPARRTARLQASCSATGVTIANPFDIHTYLWFDPPRAAGASSTRCCTPATTPSASCSTARRRPQADTVGVRCRHRRVHRRRAGRADARGADRLAAGDDLARACASSCLAGGVVPLQGQREALEALALAGAVGARVARPAPRSRLRSPRRAAGAVADAATLSEHEGKAALAAFGVPVAGGRDRRAARRGRRRGQAIGFPVVIKALSARTWSTRPRSGGVVLNVRSSRRGCRRRRAAPRGARPIAAGRADDRRRRRRDPGRRHRRSAVRPGAGARRRRRADRYLRGQRDACCRRGRRDRSAPRSAGCEVAQLLAGFRGKPAGRRAGAGRRRPRGRALRRRPRRHAARNRRQSDHRPPAAAAWSRSTS